MAKDDKTIATPAAKVEQKPATPAKKLVLGAKAPKHRAGHNATAWTALSAKLPATAAELAALPEVKACGGAKQNGILFVSYAVRRGWLAEQA